MKSFNAYLKTIRESKLRQLAEAIVRNNLNPYSVLLKAAVKTGDIASVYNAINEDWRDDAANQFRNQRFAAYAAERQRNQPPKEEEQPSGSNLPGDVNGLTSMLKSIIGELSFKHGLDDAKINALVSQAIQDAKAQGTSSFTVAPDYSGAGGSQTMDVGGNQIDPELAKKLGLGVWSTGDETPDAGQQDQEKDAPAAQQQPPSIENPSWYGQMTNAERAWFDKLKQENPEAAKQFISMHDQGHAGDAYLKPGSPEWHQAQALASQRHRGWMTDRDATFRATAGLMNRQNIRQKLAKLYGKGGDWEGEAKPLDNFDDLLHKDHTKQDGSIFAEWCHMAGIKEEKKKPRRKGR